MSTLLLLAPTSAAARTASPTPGAGCFPTSAYRVKAAQAVLGVERARLYSLDTVCYTWATAREAAPSLHPALVVGAADETDRIPP